MSRPTVEVTRQRQARGTRGSGRAGGRDDGRAGGPAGGRDKGRTVRRRRRFGRLPRTLKVTREGRYYLAITLGIGFAATNTGNNLLFLTLGMLLALIILSGLLSEAALRRLEVVRVLPKEARAGEPVLSGIRIANGNRLLPAIGLTVDEVGPQNAESHPARLFRIPAGGSARVDLRLVPTRRGEVELYAIRVTTAYPFGIFAKTRELTLPGRFVAWPARAESQAAAAREGRGDAGLARVTRGGGEDFHGLRELREGDEARHVHWRSSLRQGKLMVAEREALQGRRVTVTLAPATGAAFEAAVREAAARAEVHLDRGDEVGLEGPNLHVPFGAGAGHRRRLLTDLALVAPPGPAP